METVGIVNQLGPERTRRGGAAQGGTRPTGTPREPPYQPKPRPKPLVDPPSPPIPLTPLVACSPGTPQDVLWHIAEYAPRLRKWLIANPSATPAMLEYLAQVDGPDVARSLQILLESLESYTLNDAIEHAG